MTARTINLKAATVELSGSFDCDAIISVSLTITKNGAVVATLESYDIDHKVAPGNRPALHAAVKAICDEIEATEAWQTAKHNATTADRLDAWHREGTARVNRGFDVAR